uniref:Secreted protein n=1 Tax=Arundo donax TaxID=35708 RepID=A0A0A9D9J7_ARUDO
MIGVAPLLKDLRALSLSCCVLSPWIAVAGKPFEYSQYLNESASRLVSTKTNVRGCLLLATPTDCLCKRSSRKPLFSPSLTNSIFCSIRSVLDPTLPTVINM